MHRVKQARVAIGEQRVFPVVIAQNKADVLVVRLVNIIMNCTVLGARFVVKVGYELFFIPVERYRGRPCKRVAVDHSKAGYYRPVVIE